MHPRVPKLWTFLLLGMELCAEPSREIHMWGMKGVSLGGVNLHSFHSHWHEEGEITTSCFDFFPKTAFSSPFNTGEINNISQDIYNKLSVDFEIGNGGGRGQ